MININDYAIVADFDGTITLNDTNDELFYYNGTEETRKNEDLYKAGKAHARETFIRHFNSIPLTFEKYYKFLDENISIDPTFSNFYNIITSKKLPFYIVSGGFCNAIKHILRDFNIPESNIFANDLIMQTHLIPIFAQNSSVCTESYGPCGNCKKTCIEKIKNMTEKKILFIGDGITDRCAVKVADYSFAKGSLIQYCNDFGLEYHKFSTFADITDFLFQNCKA